MSRGDRGRLRINVGCGHEVLGGFVNIDVRRVPGVAVLGDVMRLPFAEGSVDEARAGSLLEHLDDPCDALVELHRVLKPEGMLVVRVPALGTNAAHLDPTHRYLADLAHWRVIMQGYFERVRVGSVGVRYRANPLLVGVQRLLIGLLSFHDLGQCWVLTASRKRAQPARVFRPWWAEHAAEPRAATAGPARRSLA